MKLRLDEKYLVEDVATDIEAEQVIDVEETTPNQIEEALNDSLAIALARSADEEGDYPNILLEGDAGFGKTAIVKEWAKKNNINLVYKDAKTMNATDLGGMLARDPDNPRKSTRLGSVEFTRNLSKPRSVLFLDEFNRAKQEIRGSLLTLVQDHTVWDDEAEGEMLHIENFLFTIAAVNPANSAYPGAKQLDPAERSRYRRIAVQPDPQAHLKFLTDFYTDKISKAQDDNSRLAYEGRLSLAKTILSSPDFYYDTSTEVEDSVDDNAYVPLNYRSFKMALDASKGTKDSLLKVWSDYCNYNKKQLISDILKNYVDVQDKANDVLKKHQTKSSVFVQKDSLRDKLRGVVPGLKV